MRPPRTTRQMFPHPLDLLIGGSTRTTEAHPAAIGAHFLAALGAVVGREVYTYIGETRHGAHEFWLVVGSTSTGRKGDSKGVGFSPFSDLDPLWHELLAGGLSSGEGLIHAVRDPVYTLDKKGEKVCTDEGAAEKRALFLESEFASVLKQFRRETNVLSDVARRAWDGDRVLRTITKTSPTRATDAHVSIIGHTTPEDLRRHLDETEVLNGLMNRFIFIAAQRVRKLPSPERLPAGLRQRLTQHLCDAVLNARRVKQYHQTPAFQAMWRTVYDGMSQEQPGLLGALLARGPAHVIRLSLLFAIFTKADHLDVPHLEAAVAWWKYSEASAKVIFSGTSGNRDADRLRDDLLPGESMTLSEIRDDIFSGRITSARLRDALDLLRALGEVTVAEETTGGRPALRVTRTARGEAAA